MLEQLDEIKEVSESYRRWSNGSRDADMEPIYIARTISLGEKLDALWIELSDDEKLEMLNYILDNSALLDTMVYLTEILAPRARQFDPDGFIALMLLAED